MAMDEDEQVAWILNINNRAATLRGWRDLKPYPGDGPFHGRAWGIRFVDNVEVNSGHPPIYTEDNGAAAELLNEMRQDTDVEISCTHDGYGVLYGNGYPDDGAEGTTFAGTVTRAYVAWGEGKQMAEDRSARGHIPATSPKPTGGL